MAMRLGLIDLGTNSAKFAVLEVKPGSSPTFLYRGREAVRIGHGVFETGKLDPSRMKKTIKEFKKFQAICKTMNVRQSICYATSALREAKDAKDFIKKVQQETQVKIKVISGQEEARLIALSLIAEFPSPGQRQVFIDIGGGSTEVMVVENNEILFAVSLEIGAVRITNHFIQSYPVTKTIVNEMRAYARKIIKRDLKTLTVGFDRAIGSSGTIKALSSWNRHYHGRGADESHFPISLADIDRSVKMLRDMSPPEMAALPGVGTGRAEVILAGTIILQELLSFLEIKEMTSSPSGGLLEGMVIDRFGSQDTFQIINTQEKERFLNLGRKYGFDENHANHVAKLAIQLFDQTFTIHHLSDPRCRELLYTAALLHDIGQYVEYERHHRHSQYIIMHAEELKLPIFDRKVLGLLARYHRKNLPKNEHNIFRDLSRTEKNMVAKLAAILRVADSLDSSHRQLVERLEIRKVSQHLELKAQSTHPLEAELGSCAKKANLFQILFKKEIRVVPTTPILTKAAIT